MSAPLLKAKLTDTDSGTRLDGQVSWGAVYYGGLLHVAGLFVLGIVSVVFTATQHAWQSMVLGVLAFAFGGALGMVALRSFPSQREAYESGFEHDLRALIERG